MKQRLTLILPILIVISFLILLLAAPAGQSTTPRAHAQGGDETPVPYTTGVFPRAMAFDGQRVWVANWIDNTLTVLDATNGAVLKTIDDKAVVGNQPVAMAWDGTHMWVAAYLDNQVYRMDLNGERTDTFGANQGIQRPIALLYDGAHIWIVNQGTGARPGSVMKIVADNALLLGTYEVGYFPTAIAWDQDAIWVTNGNDNTVTVLDDETGVRLGQVAVASLPISAVFDGRHIWVSHYDGTIMRIRNTSRQIDESVTLDAIPGRPIQLLYAFEQIWITNVDDASITDFRAEDGILINTLETGQFPATLVTTNTQIWVANWLDYTINTVDASGALTNTVNDPSAVATNVGLLLPSPQPTATYTPTEVPICNIALPSRLNIGDNGQVDDEGDTRGLNLREEPDLTQDNIIGNYPPLTSFVVIEGPRCVDGQAWFKVRLSNGTEGWFIEALGDDYTIEPLP